MQKDKIKILVIDKEGCFFSFINKCITSEMLSFYGEYCDCVEIDSSEINSCYHKEYDIYIIVDQDKGGEEEVYDILSCIDCIRENKQFGPHIFVVTESNNPEYLKMFIKKKCNRTNQ